jgi:hypothetical protein
MMNFDLSDEDMEEIEAPRVAWCANCDGVVDVNAQGECIGCKDADVGQQIEDVILERIPPTSPRAIECDRCGADIGEHCYLGENGEGYNHAARVEQFEAEHGVLS